MLLHDNNIQTIRSLSTNTLNAICNSSNGSTWWPLYTIQTTTCLITGDENTFKTIREHIIAFKTLTNLQTSVRRSPHLFGSFVDI